MRGRGAATCVRALCVLEGVGRGEAASPVYYIHGKTNL